MVTAATMRATLRGHAGSRKEGADLKDPGLEAGVEPGGGRPCPTRTVSPAQALRLTDKTQKCQGKSSTRFLQKRCHFAFFQTEELALHSTAGGLLCRRGHRYLILRWEERLSPPVPLRVGESCSHHLRLKNFCPMSFGVQSLCVLPSSWGGWKRPGQLGTLA